MSEQVLQAVFEELKTASGEERTRLKQKHYISLYGSSSELYQDKFWKTYRKRVNSAIALGDNYD